MSSNKILISETLVHAGTQNIYLNQERASLDLSLPFLSFLIIFFSVQSLLHNHGALLQRSTTLPEQPNMDERPPSGMKNGSKKLSEQNKDNTVHLAGAC
jgi:hypothetical protein